MGTVYQSAIGFVFPSLYEGFGLPILEAFAYDCPVITSRTSSLGEVAGDAASYINPEDPGTITHAARQLMESASERKFLVERGRERLKAFSWNTAATETLAVYEKVTGH